MKLLNIIIFFFTGVLLGANYCLSQSIFETERDESILIWCTVNSEEQKKCEELSEYLRTTNLPFESFGSNRDIFQIQCNQTFNKDECMVLIDTNSADLTTLDAGEAFVGGRYHSLVPILSELYRVEGISGTSDRMFSVAIVRKNANINSLRDLRGKRACFAGVGTLASWIIPISKLMREGGMEVVDCNNHVKSAMEFFGPSCAVNSLSDKYNPLGDNSHKLCEICGSDTPGLRCTSNDPYAGYEGALSCLFDRGEVAFVKHSSVLEYFSTRALYEANLAANRTRVLNNIGNSNSFPTFTTTTPSTTTIRNFYSPNNEFSDDKLSIFTNARRMSLSDFKQVFELLCPDGSKRGIEEWRLCSWGELPSHVVVTSSAKSTQLRTRYQKFIQNLSQQLSSASPPPLSQSFQNSQFVPQRFGGNQFSNVRESPRIFESVPKYGNRSNLLFSDSTISLRPIPEQDQTYAKYLGKSIDTILETRSCPVGRVTLCVTSDAEMTKCIKMRTALNAQLLKPEMSCYKGHSHMNCMQAIRNGNADVAVFDAGDVYKGGVHFELIPVLSEIYNLGEPEYYAVAVAYQGDADTELTYLKGKRSCHSGIGTGAGWVIPMGYLISSGRMRSYGCDSLLAASQYFTKSCLPGALSNEYNTGNEHSNLCDLCHGSSLSYCSRDASEDFYGFTGALRCLVEGGGHVAFVKHTTVSEVADGKRKETWARNLLSGDYELLCRDGTRAKVTEYARCNLGVVKGNAVVIRGGYSYNETEANAIINLFLYAQQFYGRKIEDDFNFGMFYSPAPYSDLIFQDAAQQLRVIGKNERHYAPYLGKTFLRNMALVDCRASVTSLQLSKKLILLSLTFLYHIFNFKTLTN